MTAPTTAAERAVLNANLCQAWTNPRELANGTKIPMVRCLKPMPCAEHSGAPSPVETPADGNWFIDMASNRPAVETPRQRAHRLLDELIAAETGRPPLRDSPDDLYAGNLYWRASTVAQLREVLKAINEVTDAE